MTEANNNDSEQAGHKQEFVDFMVEADVLKFGSFVTKSGRTTPYFINTGRYRTGDQVRRLGHFYAEAITRTLGSDFDVLFGPAYKGIPLVVATAAAFAERGRDVAYCFNRKEAKDHGEGGVFVGHELSDGDRVLIVEDITTAGTAVRESVPLLKAAAEVTLSGLVVSVDRCERGVDDRAALAALSDEFAMPAFAIVDVYDIIARADLSPDQATSMRAYLDLYGAKK